MTENTKPVRAVLWDFGGVISSSPFEAFNRYESANGLPRDFIRSLNTANAHDNAWARLERSELDLDGFRAAFEAEALAAGHALDAGAVLAMLYGEIRADMVAALKAVAVRYRTACLTNNIGVDIRPPEMVRESEAIMEVFDVVVESSKIGVRKPEPRFYELACEMLDVAPDESVFLDDLGINLKPARAMGMRTIKVVTAEQALDELEAALGHAVRS
jgi:putative hydrolase of the HAD superfamily